MESALCKEYVMVLSKIMFCLLQDGWYPSACAMVALGVPPLERTSNLVVDPRRQQLQNGHLVKRA